MSDYLSVCEEAARAGGAVLLDWIGRFRVREKAPSDLVTEADFASQEKIKGILLGAFPDHQFLGEEDISGEVTLGTDDSAYHWVVDPLDGTTNYVHQMPQFCVSVALERAGRILVGAVYNPIDGECFTAVAGEGAFLAGKRLSTSDVEQVPDALIAASLPPQVQSDSIEVKRFVEVATVCQAMRRMGSAALNLSYIAAGRIDAYWATSAKAWDVAAGVLLIREAGGIVTGVKGQPFDLAHPEFLAAATDPLHRKVLATLASVEAQPS